MTPPLYNVGDDATHAVVASASPEYIIQPLVFAVALLPPINQRLYPPPTQSATDTHANCEEFGLLIPFRQLNPSLEK